MLWKSEPHSLSLFIGTATIYVFTAAATVTARGSNPVQKHYRIMKLHTKVHNCLIAPIQSACEATTYVSGISSQMQSKKPLIEARGI